MDKLNMSKSTYRKNKKIKCIKLFSWAEINLLLEKLTLLKSQSG